VKGLGGERESGHCFSPVIADGSRNHSTVFIDIRGNISRGNRTGIVHRFRGSTELVEVR
jgi:hypothetical protein